MIFTKVLLIHAIIGAASATVAAEILSPWATVFDDHSLIVAIFGALGGSTRWIFLREKFRDGLRLLVLGALVAFGVGSLWTLVVDSYLGDAPENLLAQPGVAYNGAYLTGLFAVVILGRWLDAKEDEDNG